MIITDVEDRDLFILRGVCCEIVENTTARILRTRYTHQESQSGREVNGAYRRNRILMNNSWTSSDKCRVHIDVVSKIDKIGQITVLTKELREGDPLTRSCRIELVGRTQNNYNITTTIGMQRITAIYISQL